jgi:hypothetical protein
MVLRKLPSDSSPTAADFSEGAIVVLIRDLSSYNSVACRIKFARASGLSNISKGGPDGNWI